MTKMNPEIKEAWLKKLRSGELKQAVGSLFYEDKCCAIGVLALVCEERGMVEIDPLPGGDNTRAVYPIVDGKTNFRSRHRTGLPVVVRDAIGLGHRASHIVMSMNDDQRAPFETIAAHIEHHL